MRRYLALSPPQMDRLIEAKPGTWARIEFGAAEVTTRQVRALLRRVPELRSTYGHVGRRFPEFGLLTDRGEARWPEGHEHLHEYLKSLRVHAGLTRRGFAGEKSVNSLDDIERGKYTPGREWIDEYLRLGGGATRADVAGCYRLPVEEPQFPSLWAVEGLGEYVQYLQRVNNLASADTARLLGVDSHGLFKFLDVARHDELTVLRIWRLILHRAGPYNDLAQAWRYRYRMDPAEGDVFPRPELFDQPRDFAFSLRLYHTLTWQQLASRTGLRVDQIALAETEHGYSPPHLRTIHDAGLIPDDALHTALNRFHPVAPAHHDTIGSWLAALRRNACMTQTQLAAAIGHTGPYISNIVSDVVVPSRAVAHGLCVALGVPDALREQGLAHFYPPADTTPANHDAFGSWLAAVRHNAGITQQQLATTAGVSVADVRAIENGAEPSVFVAHDLCVARDVAPELRDEGLRRFYPDYYRLLSTDPIEHDTIGSWLAALRRNAGMTQTQLATATGHDYYYISNIENGHSVPRRSVVRALGVALGVPDTTSQQGLLRFYPPADTTPGDHTLGSWLRAHLYNADLIQAQLATSARLSSGHVHQITHDEITPLLRTFRRLCDALDIHGPPRMDATRSFYSDRYPIAADPDDEQLFWRLVDTLVDSPQERELRNQIYERYAWIAEHAARGWARTPADRDDREQVARVAILTAIVNHTPTSPFIVHAFANCRGAIRGAYFDRRYPDLDPRTRRIMIAVAAHLGRVDPAAAAHDPADIAADLMLNRADVTHAPQILSQHTVSLDQPATNRSREIQREVADPSATRAFADSDFVDSVRAALADLPDPATSTRLVILHLVDGTPLDQAAQQLGLSLQTATETISTAIPRLRAAFQPPPPDDA